MSVLVHAVRPNTLELALETRTPIYTGGLRQGNRSQGNRLFPSGLLGNLRKFSCWTAAALGDATFEAEVWGELESDYPAKQLGLRIDPRGLETPQWRSGPIKCGKGRGWYFNEALTGELQVSVTRLDGLSDAHWSILTTALRIQIRHATVGAKDQFGLGVVGCENLPEVTSPPVRVAEPLASPGLHRAFFARIVFDCSAPRDLNKRLEHGLCLRKHLRNALRAGDGKHDEHGMTSLRHATMGFLRGKRSESSAVNVSALYPIGNDRCAIRVWGVFPHTSDTEQYRPERAFVMQRLRDALRTFDARAQGPCIGQQRQQVEWQDAAEQGDDIAVWLNHLAGNQA